jgi:hypothetical protein
MPESVVTPTQPDRQGLAIASLVLGILNLFTWCIPVCGFPFAIAGIVTGIFGLKSSKRGLAIAGIILSAIGFILSIINSIAGVFIFQNFDWQNFDPEQFIPEF